MADFDFNLPENADKILFAEDLVNYIMFASSVFEMDPYTHESTLEKHREFIHNAFNENVKMAVNFLSSQLSKSNSHKFELLERAHLVSAKTYKHLAKNLGKKYFSKGFDARKFLFYCVHLSNMACMFFSFGLEEARSLAVRCILESIADYDLLSGGWDTVDIIAKRFANMSSNVNTGNLKSSLDDNMKVDYMYAQSPRRDSPKSSDSDEDGIDLFLPNVEANVNAGGQREEDIISMVELDDFDVEESYTEVCRH